MKLSVIITTYNAEDWLHKVLIGYSVQTEKDFEVIIADDGSRPETKTLIDQFAGKFNFPIVHVWHEDIGYFGRRASFCCIPLFVRLSGSLPIGRLRRSKDRKIWL